MFFRRERPKVLTFEDHMSAARAAGFREESVGGREDSRRAQWRGAVFAARARRRSAASPNARES